MKSEFDIHEIMSELALSRPAFHSEADFQHAIAMLIHGKYSPKSIRLEVPFRASNQAVLHVDLFVVLSSGEKVAIELKYKTRKYALTINNEDFDLKNHGAQDCGRYDFIVDITRIERMVSEKFADIGLAVVLSNDKVYWDVPRQTIHTPNYAEFRIHEGLTLKGTMSWPTPIPKSVKSRKAPLKLENSYPATWKPYTNKLAGVDEKAEFKYMVASIVSPNIRVAGTGWTTCRDSDSS